MAVPGLRDNVYLSHEQETPLSIPKFAMIEQDVDMSPWDIPTSGGRTTFIVPVAGNPDGNPPLNESVAWSCPTIEGVHDI